MGPRTANFTAGVITVSDRSAAGLREDRGGPAVVAWLRAFGVHVVRYEIVSDEPRLLLKSLSELCDGEGGVSLVVTTGGTGLGPRDRVPATLDGWADVSVAGFGERMRAISAPSNPRAILSRGGGWLWRRTLVLAVPGSPRGAVECLDAISPALEHGLDIVLGADHPVSDQAQGGRAQK